MTAVAAWPYALDEGDRRHGSPRGYWLKCRCPECREAKRVDNADYAAAHVDRRRLTDAAYRARNGAEVRERQRARYAATAERERARAVAYAAAHPDGRRARDASRRARKRGALVEHVDRLVVWERDAGACYLCGLPADPARWDLDHVDPLDNGGEHSYANTAVTHPRCNQSKGARPWPSVEWEPRAA